MRKKKELLEQIEELEAKRSEHGLTFYLAQAHYDDNPDLTTMGVLRGQKALVPAQRSERKKMLLYGIYCALSAFL
jgi:hypothetical protein